MAEILKTVVRQVNGEKDLGIAGINTPQPTMVKAMPAWQLAGVRAVRAGIQVFLSSVGVGATGLPEWILNDPHPPNFVAKIQLGLILAGSTAVVSALQDTAEFLKGLDVTHPQLRG